MTTNIFDEVVPSSVLTSLVFNEVLPDPNSSSNNFDTDGDGTAETGDEFVELYNTTSNALDISGLQFWDAGNNNYFTIPDGTTLGPNSFVVLVSDVSDGSLPTVEAGSQAFSASSGLSGIINNGGDNLVVYDPATDGYIQAVYNGDGADTPTVDYDGFSATANLFGTIQDLGNDTDGISLALSPDGDTSNPVQHNTIGDGDVLASPGAANDGADNGGGGGPNTNVVINEVDADTPGNDSAEFIELYDGGVGNTALDGLVVVFFNGSDDASYEVFDLDGFSTDADGFFVLGNPGVANVDLTFDPGSSGALQNGADAVAIYQGDAADFPNDTPVTTNNLLDAIAYDTNDSDASGLLTGLGLTTQFNEDANNDKDNESNSRVPDGADSFAAQAPTPGTPNQPPAVLISIYDIQGGGDDFTSPEYASPLLGQQVTTEGVVTAIASNGVYIQDVLGDDNDDTSDGIFVFTGDSQTVIPTTTIGDLVEVSGTVDEFFQATQLDMVSAFRITGTGSIAPVVLGVDRSAPTEIVDDANSTEYDVTRDGRDFYESLEGMLVTLPDAVAVSLTRTFANGTDGEFYAIAEQGTGTTGANARGGITISEDTSANNPIGADLNPERLQIDNDLATDSFPVVEVGDLFGDITGVINYSFNDYAISPLAPVEAISTNNLSPETTNLAGTADQLTVATFNVLNLDPGDPAAKFDALGGQIANNLQAPDIIALQEVQDNNGSTNNGVTDANQTLQALVDAIATAGGPAYKFIDNTFITNNASGGQPGANIRVAFLYRSDRVDLVENSVRPIGDQNPGSPFNGARLPLAADFTFGSETVTVIGNHFSSKGGSDPLFGDEQPPANGSIDERIAQANAVNDFISAELAGNPNAKIITLGDFNEFQFFEPLEILEQNLTNLTETLPETERYTFNFEGNAQALDHVLVTSNLAEIAEYDIVHVNSEFADAPSDHDPAIVRLSLDSPNSAPISVDDEATTGGEDTINIAVLTNDSDPDGDDIAIESFDDSATSGLVTDNGDGTFDYDPNGFFAYLAAGETATDTFGYTLSDGELTDSAEVTITIEGPNEVTNSGMAFSFNTGTNGGANRFGFDGDSFFVSGQGVRGRPKFDDFDDLLVVAAELYDGVLERSGTINDQRLPSGNGPNNINVNDNNEVTIGGRGIGGSYRIQFENTQEAETFEAFVERILNEIDENDAVATDPDDFRFDALTGGSDVRIFFDDVNDEFGFTTDAGATQSRFNTLEVFVESLATNVFGGSQQRDGNFNAMRIAEGRTPNVRANGNDDVIISGQSVGGRFSFSFGNGNEAGLFADAIGELLSSIDEANAIAVGDM
ncbi:MAG: lamin tail domain-containing protein [Leptolyngbyaceae cyanobacterium]